MRSPSSRTLSWISSEVTSIVPASGVIATNSSSLNRSPASVSPVGAVGPRGGEERYMIVGRRVGDAETDGHPPEEGWVGDAQLRCVVLAYVEDEDRKSAG